MRKITRRSLLRQSPAVLAIAAVPASAAVAASPAEAAPIENPALVSAYERFLAARAEVTAAKDALEWLADEWRHLWPLAPEEILGFAGADNYTEGVERDIAGRIIRRDTGDFTKRLNRRQREELRVTCFTVHTPDWFLDIIGRWEKPRTGKTEKALARNLAEQAKVLQEFRKKLHICEHYHAETARLREASGVEKIKLRIKAAEVELARTGNAVSHEPAYTFDGLRLKADVLQVQDEGMAIYLSTKGGALGGMGRFIQATLDVIGRASA